MYYSIFRNNILVANVKPDDSSELSQKKQEEDIIRLNFTLEDYIDIRIGDYIAFEKTNQLYFLNKNPRVIESPKNNKYECIFEGTIHNLRKTKIFLDTPKASGFYRDYKFPLTGNAYTFLLFIIDNLNRNGGSFVVGNYADTATTKVDFNNWNVFEAIASISETLGFSWYLEGNVLNFDSKQVNTAYVFQVGRKVGFKELTRARVDNANVETVVYGYGGTENMPPRTAESGTTYDSTLLTENRLDFIGEEGLSKLSKNTDTYGFIEVVKEFDIKPEFTGVVDTVYPENLRTFRDSSIVFDINSQLLEGITPKIMVLTGKLIGLTFNISFDYATSIVTLDYYSDESGSYPNELINIEIGDQYKLYDIVIPNSYLLDAQTRLQTATQEYLDENSKSLEYYSGEIDAEFIQENNVVINLGDIVRIISTEFGIDNLYEIKLLTQKITNPFIYSIGFGDTLPKSLISTLKSNTFNTNQSIYNVQKNSVINNETINIIGEEVTWQQL